MSTFTLSLEDKPGQSYLHGFHLGTIERIARQITEEKMQAMGLLMPLIKDKVLLPV